MLRLTNSFWLCLLLIVFCPAMLWVAWLIWQNEVIAEEVVAADLASIPQYRLSSMPPLVTEPLVSLLSTGQLSVEVDSAYMVDVAEEYIKRRPLDANGWLYASQYSQRGGDLGKAAEYLSVAHLLSRRHHGVLLKVFNRYLELGMIDQAMPVARDLVSSQPNSFRRLFYLLTRLNPDYKAVVDQVIPRDVPTHREYKDDIYYGWALRDAVRSNNGELAKVVWSAIPDELKFNSAHGLSYLNYLVGLQHWQDVMLVWQGLTGSDVELNQIAQPDFETKMIESSPCWSSREVKGADWSIDANAYDSEQSLMVEFNGEENVNFSHLSCYVGVEPGESYRLNGIWSGEGISTLSGPFVDLFSPGVKGFYKRNQPKIGSWPWESFELEFSVPEGVEIISLRIRRAKTDMFDSKISGRVWFDNFKLLKVIPVDLNTSVRPDTALQVLSDA